jgi:adenine deaminase
MITTRAVPALPAHHRHVAQSNVTPQDFADALAATLRPG